MFIVRFAMFLMYVLGSILIAGCENPTSPASPISSFEGREAPGIFTHDLLYTYTGSHDLKDVNFQVTVYYENGETPVTKKYWANWKPNETKRVNVSAFRGSVERSDLSGAAMLDGTKVALSGSFRSRD